MSERKDAEIKFRVTPSEKARWQEYAKSSDLGLSELIRREVNEGIRQNDAQQTAELSATDHVPGRDCAWSPCPTCGHLTSIATKPACICDGFEVSCEVVGKDCVNATPQKDVSTSDEVGARADWNVKADWTFEARNA